VLGLASQADPQNLPLTINFEPVLVDFPGFVCALLRQPHIHNAKPRPTIERRDVEDTEVRDKPRRQMKSVDLATKVFQWRTCHALKEDVPSCFRFA
jgi:hypothetical protein